MKRQLKKKKDKQALLPEVWKTSVASTPLGSRSSSPRTRTATERSPLEAEPGGNKKQKIKNKHGKKK